LHFYNNVQRPSENKLLLFLRAAAVQKYDMYAAWQVLAPPLHEQQTVELTVRLSAAVAPFGHSLDTYCEPIPLPFNTHPLEVVNAPSDGCICAGRCVENVSLTPKQVGLKNHLANPRTDLSVLWYLNDTLIMQTHNTRATQLRPGALATFQLEPSISMLLSPSVRCGPLYPEQIFTTSEKFALSPDATDLYFEICTNEVGIDYVRELSEEKYQQHILSSRVAR
jgi:hypothetical protein